MIIDSHTHIGKDWEVAVHDLLVSMDEAKIDKSLVFASALQGNGTTTNTDLLKSIAPHKDRLYGVGYVDIANQDTNPIEPFLDQIVAAKFYLGYEHYYPSSSKVLKVCEKLVAANKPAIFHCGDCHCSDTGARVRYSHPLKIDDVAVSFPNLKIIIAHLGWPFVRECAYVCYRHPNVYADVSGAVYGEFKSADVNQFRQSIHQFLDIAPAEKLLFGTDFPISSQKSYVETMKDMVVCGVPFSLEKMSEITTSVFNLKG